MWWFKSWFCKRRKIEKIENWEDRYEEYLDYAKQLGVHIDDIKFHSYENLYKLISRISEFEREWRAASFAMLSAVVAIISAIGSWMAVLSK